MVGSSWIPIRHLHNNDGSAGCGGVALYAVRRIADRERIESAPFRLLSGRRPRPHQAIRCGACRAGIDAPADWDFFGDVRAQAVDVEVVLSRP